MDPFRSLSSEKLRIFAQYVRLSTKVRKLYFCALARREVI
jgi:hypothetical protein